TRNMVTGASTADVAIILVDARKGVLEQTRRHAFLSALLGIPRLVVAVNKMDLVDYDEATFEAIRTEFTDFAAKLEVHDVTFVPLSALRGDNVVDRSDAMPWYTGPALLDHLENVHIASDRNLTDVRFPVQYVIRPQRSDGFDHRSFAGTIAGGEVNVGDEIVVLPRGQKSVVTKIWAPGGRELESARAGSAITLALDDEIDIVRGEMIARAGAQPRRGTEFEATVCWFADEDVLQSGRSFHLKQTTRETRAVVTALDFRLDVNTLAKDHAADQLALNEIGQVTIRSQAPLMYDPYRENRTTGAFILIDEVTGNTVGAGMIEGPGTSESGVVWHAGAVSSADRAAAFGSDVVRRTIWFTGLSGSGKSSIAVELEKALVAAGLNAYILDGDNLRHGLNSDLGFSEADRDENVRRTAEVAALLTDAGVVAICALISPMRAQRELARAAHDRVGVEFIEVFVDTPIEECENRDPKGMYAKARAGEIENFTGVSSPYEAPENADLRITPEDGTAEEAAALIVQRLFGSDSSTVI
ncbi:adenylyl-sulfate kinase, partial [Dietzia sp.]|uniref:adenylyl-sulfate kinase n=1 Tax=Dietzia sp. TaxID=1871616 RepID=UPI002FD986ED